MKTLAIALTVLGLSVFSLPASARTEVTKYKYYDDCCRVVKVVKVVKYNVCNPCCKVVRPCCRPFNSCFGCW
jgi:hypothetical protein